MNLQRAAIWACIGAALTLVFWAYLRPDVVMVLAQQIWSCF